MCYAINFDQLFTQILVKRELSTYIKMDIDDHIRNDTHRKRYRIYILSIIIDITIIKQFEKNLFVSFEVIGY